MDRHGAGDHEPSTDVDALRRRVWELEAALARVGAVVAGAAGSRAGADVPGVDELSGREREVLDLLRQGMRVPTIAVRLGISPYTVRNHLASIYRRLGVGSQRELLELFHL